MDQTTPSPALAVLYHQHAEGGSGHSGTVFVTRWYVGHMTVGVWNSIKCRKYVPKIAHALGLILRPWRSEQRWSYQRRSALDAPCTIVKNLPHDLSSAQLGANNQNNRLTCPSMRIIWKFQGAPSNGPEDPLPVGRLTNTSLPDRNSCNTRARLVSG